MVEQTLIRLQSGQWLRNTPLRPLLGLTGGRIGPDPINRLVMSSFLNLHLQQVPNLYLLVARRRWLRVNCVENRNLTSAEKLATARKPTLNSSILVAYPPSQPRRMGYPLGLFPTQVGLRGGWRSAGPVKNIQQIWRLKTKKINGTSENEAADFPRFIVIESLEEVCLAIFSPFLIEKVICTRASPKTVKKTRNGNLLVEVDSRRQAENILKIKTFHTTKCRAYPHEKLNTSKGVIRSRELALVREDEVASTRGMQVFQQASGSPDQAYLDPRCVYVGYRPAYGPSALHLPRAIWRGVVAVPTDVP